jgi:hypothetical protein
MTTKTLVIERVVNGVSNKRIRYVVHDDGAYTREIAWCNHGVWDSWSAVEACESRDIWPGLRQLIAEVGNQTGVVQVTNGDPGLERERCERDAALAKLTPREREILGVA